MSKSSRSTMRTYVIGFLLSLLLTVTSYFSVVNKSMAGTALLTLILGFAVLQMFVQIFFFLHLGRGPKPLYNVIFFAGTVGIILVVVIGSIFIIHNLYGNMSPSVVIKKLAQNEGIAQVNGEKTGACKETKTNHKVTVTHRKATPDTIDAKLCDTITFINNDEEELIIAFGPHEHHESYGGEMEIPVTSERPKTITLNQLGTVTFHDHDDTRIRGTFTVTY